MSGEQFTCDCRDGLRGMIERGVKAQMCVTSPPYWGLRDYGVDGQLGLEETPEEYLATMAQVFRLVREVLADDGTLWMNMGDTYAPDGACVPVGLKPKDLCGMPWRVAFALQADGWYLRSDIIWHKPNPMPESVTDRPTKSHEYMFLLSKGPKYFYDAEAVRERTGRESEVDVWKQSKVIAAKTSGNVIQGKAAWRHPNLTHPAGRNCRTVWTIATEPFADAHFATFPKKLVEPCILAGSRPGDVVLDPFMGSGTVAEVAENLGRGWIGIDLNPAYEAMQSRRAAQRAMVLA